MELDTLRHSCSHIMAQAVKELWPDIKLAIGPAIEDGFYYDFDTSAVLSAGKKESFSPQDLEKIEIRMAEIIKEDLIFAKEEIAKQEALNLFKEKSEDYKVELTNGLPDDKITIYKTGDKYLDLCKGPHVDSTGQIKAFKLLSIAGAYWHGVETNPMLQRIYGTAFFNQAELDDYIKYLEESKKRDHRKLGRELKYFDIYFEGAGPGLVFYHPKGAILRNIIEDYERKEHAKRGYQTIVTPHIMKQDLWVTSGHYDYYRDNMFTMQV